MILLLLTTKFQGPPFIYYLWINYNKKQKFMKWKYTFIQDQEQQHSWSIHDDSMCQWSWMLGNIFVAKKSQFMMKNNIFDWCKTKNTLHTLWWTIMVTTRTISTHCWNYPPWVHPTYHHQALSLHSPSQSPIWPPTTNKTVVIRNYCLECFISMKQN